MVISVQCLGAFTGADSVGGVNRNTSQPAASSQGSTQEIPL